MATKTKIKITDDKELRNILDDEYESSSQITLCKYTLSLATHIMKMIKYQDIDNAIIKEGYLINQKWQMGDARMHDVRQAGFKIHEMAKACDDIIMQTALRVVGQAVSTGHMREHAMVASDYAIKVVSLLSPDDMEAVKQERIWQIEHLREIKKLITS